MPYVFAIGSAQLDRGEDEGVALRVVEAHRYRTPLRHRHEAAGIEPISFQEARIHEVVDDEGQLVHPTTRGP